MIPIDLWHIMHPPPWLGLSAEQLGPRGSVTPFVWGKPMEAEQFRSAKNYTEHFYSFVVFVRKYQLIEL